MSGQYQKVQWYRRVLQLRTWDLMMLDEDGTLHLSAELVRDFTRGMHLNGAKQTSTSASTAGTTSPQEF